MCLLAATLALGCKDKAKVAPASGTTGSAAALGSAGVATGSAGSAASQRIDVDSPPLAPDPGKNGPTVLVLPKLEGAEAKLPPHPTTKPLTKATFEQLANLKYIGFAQEVRGLTDTLLDVRYVTESKPRLAVVIKVWPCKAPGPGACEPLTEEVWTKKKPELLAAMKALATDPKTTLEIGAVDLGGGAKGIYTYQVGFTVGNVTKGEGSFSDAYKLHWNDGVNQIMVSAEYKDDATASREDMLSLAPKEDLERIARSYFDAFTHSWE